MILGIKYMMGSIEERASYKKSMLPYFIGAILLFGAVNITAVLYDTLQIDDQGYTAAMKFINDHKDDLDAIHDRASAITREVLNAEKTGILDEKTIEEKRREAEVLNKYWREHRKSGQEDE